MSETLPVPVYDDLCLGLNQKGKPCSNARKDDTDDCFRHQPRKMVPAGAESEPAPFPELPTPEELTTAAGVRTLITRLVAYIAENKNADLPRVYAMQAYRGDAHPVE